MHLMTLDAEFDLHWGHQTWQQGKISSGLFAKPSCPLFHKSAHKFYNYLSDHHSIVHLMNFDPDCDLIWCHLIGQPDEISSGMFADVDKPSCTLFHRSAR